MSLVGNWQRETERFAPELSVYVHHGPDRLDGSAFTRRAKKADLVLSTYGLAARDQQLLATVPWRRLVLDEAQQIKNSAARTTQSVRAIPAERRIAMTGTPVENRLAELWSIMQFLNPGLLGSEKSFRERFAIPIERRGDDEAAARLRRVTAPFVLRRLKTDRTIIADLPDKIEMKEFCTLTREQATLYQAVVDDMLDRIDNSEGMERRGLVLATMMKLKQVCNHPAHFLADGSALPGRSGKLTRLTEVLEEAIQEGDRALVFTQFTEMGDMLERYLRRHLACEVLWLHGGVPKKKRDAMVERFQGADGPARVPAVPESRGHRAQPHRGDARGALRPLVEPGRGEPGDGQGLPDRAAPQRAGAQIHLRGHARGADRRHDRGQAGAGGAYRRLGGGLDHRDVDRATARGHRPVGRRGGRGLMPARREPERRPARRQPRPPAPRGDGWWPPTSVPIPVEGGLQARSRRGAIGETWWSQRFIAVLESFGMGSRLQRGKRYARTGQVVAMDIGPGQVKASVQGSRTRPYRVFIETRALTGAEWDAVENAMASNAAFVAPLLAGEMPHEIETAFAGSSGSLFPASAADLDAACSCPDWENPCKHIAAVFFLLAEAFDDDPFLIFAWRGRNKEELLAGLRARRRRAGPIDGDARSRVGRGDGRWSGRAVRLAPGLGRAGSDSLVAGRRGVVGTARRAGCTGDPSPPGRRAGPGAPPARHGCTR